MASLKNANTLARELAGIIVISSPRQAPRFTVADSDITSITAPKLFVGSKGDTIVPYSETLAMYQLASPPKALHTFDGSAHGTDILKTSDHDNLVKLILDFVAMAMPNP